ncbi:MAG: tetratricopeptide repeat protein [Azonexus sp.]|jgi:tetratricopeptide (TPR) repeat protein|uniref:tetratricopeptide repeat protein n=1 Tax=Azonexus sp. TaxID=1872668 RepID=UPI00283A4054|nr:tetratricopeptide repeat protein [Azonexus sp.]MDR0776682.1 tetratricopeptide repeat protein [Azonexus sp.]
MHAKLPVTALALTLGLSLALPGYGAPPTAGKKPRSAAVEAQQQEEYLLPRVIFQSLLGEFALQRGETRIGVEAWADLAQRTRDPQVVARAVEVATLARQFDLAMQLSRLWLEIEPESTRARQAQSSLLVVTGRLDELAPQVAVLLERDPDNIANNLLHLNRMLARHSDKKAVQRLVDQLAAPYASLPEAHFAMAQAAANAGDELRASTEMEKALLLRPDWEAAALARAQLQARHSTASAISGLEDFVTRHPGAGEARLALARLLIGEKRYDDARQHFDRLLKDNPDNPAVIYPIAMLALQQGDAQTGRQQLEKLLGTNFPDQSMLHFFLGQLDQEQKKPDAALAHFMQVTTGNQVVAARARAAQILLQQGKPEEARELLHNTRGGSAEERTQLTLAEAQLLRDAGRLGEAYEVLAQALVAQPDNPDLLYDAALTAERAGKPELLESHLQHLLRLQPDHAHALNALGYSWADRNQRLPEAYELIARAVALQPDDPFIADSLGWVQYRLGRLEEALATLERAYGIKADPEIAAHLGEVLWQLDRKDEAKKLLADAIRQHPDSEVLAAAIKKLQP